MSGGGAVGVVAGWWSGVWWGVYRGRGGLLGGGGGGEDSGGWVRGGGWLVGWGGGGRGDRCEGYRGGCGGGGREGERGGCACAFIGGRRVWGGGGWRAGGRGGRRGGGAVKRLGAGGAGLAWVGGGRELGGPGARGGDDRGGGGERGGGGGGRGGAWHEGVTAGGPDVGGGGRAGEDHLEGTVLIDGQEWMHLPCRRHYLVSMITFLLELLRLLPFLVGGHRQPPSKPRPAPAARHLQANGAPAQAPDDGSSILGRAGPSLDRLEAGSDHCLARHRPTMAAATLPRVLGPALGSVYPRPSLKQPFHPGFRIY